MRGSIQPSAKALTMLILVSLVTTVRERVRERFSVRTVPVAQAQASLGTHGIRIDPAAIRYGAN